jgi:hypothetical protein
MFTYQKKWPFLNLNYLDYMKFNKNLEIGGYSFAWSATVTGLLFINKVAAQQLAIINLIHWNCLKQHIWLRLSCGDTRTEF